MDKIVDNFLSEFKQFIFKSLQNKKAIQKEQLYVFELQSHQLTTRYYYQSKITST